MGFFKKIFKGVKKVFKGIGKVIKKVTKPLGKLINKMGIFGQIGMFVLSMYAGPYLFSALKSSFLSPIFTGVGKLGAAIKTGIAKTTLGRKLIAGASRIASAARGTGKFIGESIGSIAKGVKNLVTTTVKAGAEKLGLRAPELTSIKYDLAASKAGSGITVTSPDAITAAAGGDGYGKAMKNVFDQIKDDQAESFWDLQDAVAGRDKYSRATSILNQPDMAQPFDPNRDVLKDYSTDYSFDIPKLTPEQAAIESSFQQVQAASPLAQQVRDPITGEVTKALGLQTTNLPLGEQLGTFDFDPSPQAFTSMPTTPTTVFSNIGNQAGIAGTQQALQSLLTPGATSVVDEFEPAPRQVVQDRSDFTTQIAAVTAQQAGVYQPITQFGQPFQYQPWAMQAANNFYNTSTFDSDYGRLLGA